MTSYLQVKLITRYSEGTYALCNVSTRHRGIKVNLRANIRIKLNLIRVAYILLKRHGEFLKVSTQRTR